MQCASVGVHWADAGRGGSVCCGRARRHRRHSCALGRRARRGTVNPLKPLASKLPQHCGGPDLRAGRLGLRITLHDVALQARQPASQLHQVVVERLVRILGQLHDFLVGQKVSVRALASIVLPELYRPLLCIRSLTEPAACVPALLEKNKAEGGYLPG